VTTMGSAKLHVIVGGREPVEARGSWWCVNLLVMDRERVLRGWTRGELARRAHVDPGTVSDMFRGRRRPVLGTIQALTVTLGLSLADVIQFDEQLGTGQMGGDKIRQSA
jgi:hypothetical protein